MSYDIKYLHFNPKTYNFWERVMTTDERLYVFEKLVTYLSFNTVVQSVGHFMLIQKILLHTNPVTYIASCLNFIKNDTDGKKQMFIRFLNEIEYKRDVLTVHTEGQSLNDDDEIFSHISTLLQFVKLETDGYNNFNVQSNNDMFNYMMKLQTKTKKMDVCHRLFHSQANSIEMYINDACQILHSRGIIEDAGKLLPSMYAIEKVGYDIEESIFLSDKYKYIKQIDHYTALKIALFADKTIKHAMINDIIFLMQQKKELYKLTLPLDVVKEQKQMMENLAGNETVTICEVKKLSKSKKMYFFKNETHEAKEFFAACF